MPKFSFNPLQRSRPAAGRRRQRRRRGAKRKRRNVLERFFERALSLRVGVVLAGLLVIFSVGATLGMIAGRSFDAPAKRPSAAVRSEEHTSALQSLMRISYAVFCLKKKKRATHYIILTKQSD